MGATRQIHWPQAIRFRSVLRQRDRALDLIVSRKYPPPGLTVFDQLWRAWHVGNDAGARHAVHKPASVRLARVGLPTEIVRQKVALARVRMERDRRNMGQRLWLRAI